MNWQRAFVRSLIAVAACLTLAAAQTPSPPQPNHPMSLEPSTLSRQMPETLAGIESGKVVRWTRNFHTDTNRHQITIAKKKLDLSDGEFRQRAISTTLSSNSVEIKSELANPGSDGEKIHH